MPKMRLRPGLRPGPRCGSLQRSPDPLAGNGGGAPREGRGKERRRGGKGRGGEERGREGKGGKERKGKGRKGEGYSPGTKILAALAQRSQRGRVIFRVTEYFA